MRARQLGTVSRRQIDLACRSFAHSPAHAIIQKGSRSVHFSQDKSRTKLRQVKTKTGNFPHFCPQFPELEPNAEKCAPKPAACISRWAPPHLCGGRSASALREKLDFNQCALALGSQNPGAKAHSRIERPFCWTRVQLPPAKAGGSHQKAVARVAHIVRPTAGAIIRNCSISSANWCGYSD